MAAAQGNNPALAKLMTMAGDFNEAKDSKNPMAGCQAPDGVYIARCTDNVLRQTQAQDPMIVFNLPILCSQEGDRQYAGEPARIMHIIKETEKQTRKQKFERLCWDIQTFGYDTSQMKSIKELPEYLAAIKNDMACVVIAISTSENGMQNVNLRGRISNEEVEQLLGESLGDVPAAPAEEVAAAPAEEVDETTAWLQANCTFHDEHGLYHHEETDVWYNSDGTEYDPNAVAEEPAADGYEEVAAPAPAAAPPKPAGGPPKPAAAKPAGGPPKPAAAKPGPVPKPAGGPPKKQAAAPAKPAATKKVPPRPPAR